MKQTNVLYAFYDFEVAPATFDIACFLSIAEIERKKLGCAFLHVVIVPGPANGFREKDFDTYRALGAGKYEIDVMRWRLCNVVVPCCWMIPSCQKVTVCTSREEAQALEMSLVEHVFPRTYTVNSPVSCHETYNLVDAASQERYLLSSMQSTPQACSFVNDWIKTNVGERKLVTISLRECAYEHARNSSIKDWAAFAQSLDSKIYCPVVLRDVDTAFGPAPSEIKGLLIFREAVWNVELRSALYELSYLNMYVNNGPGVFCLFNRKTRFLTIFKKNTCGAGTYGYLQGQGLIPGSQFKWSTPFQVIVWDDDKFDVLKTTFKEMCARIESFTSAKIEDLIATYKAAINENNLNNAEWISSLLIDRFNDHYAAWYIRAVALRLTNQPKEALPAVQRSLQLNATLDSLAELISIYQALGFHEKANQLSRDIARAQELKQPITIQWK